MFIYIYIYHKIQPGITGIAVSLNRERINEMMRKECLWITVSCFSDYTYIILWCWKDHKDLSQGLVVCDAVTDCVSVYCQLGNGLSEQVRKAGPFQCCFEFNILHTYFQCKIPLGFSVINFKATLINIYHNFLSNPTVLKK
jgi:hypothetical protein